LEQAIVPTAERDGSGWGERIEAAALTTNWSGVEARVAHPSTMDLSRNNSVLRSRS
jgi:hypothetical protein